MAALLAVIAYAVLALPLEAKTSDVVALEIKSSEIAVAFDTFADIVEDDSEIDSPLIWPVVCVLNFKPSIFWFDHVSANYRRIAVYRPTSQAPPASILFV